MKNMKNIGGLLVKWGYVIRGWMYVSIGWLAIKWAFGVSQISPGSKSAVLHVADSSFGKILLVFVIIGLIGYAGWGILRSYREKKLQTKLGYLVSVAGYLSLIWPAIVLLISGQKSPDQGWHYLLTYVGNPVGRFIVIACGIGVLFGAFTQAKEAWKLNYLGRIGMSARATMIALAGVFLVLGGIKVDPQAPAAFDQAIMALKDIPFGEVWVTLLGGGLIALGMHSFTLVCKVNPSLKNEARK